VARKERSLRPESGWVDHCELVHEPAAAKTVSVVLYFDGTHLPHVILGLQSELVNLVWLELLVRAIAVI
jgi:hypothetical protein